MKRKFIPWTDSEITTLQKTVAQYPNNLQYGFEQAAEKLHGRSASSVAQKYYVLSKATNSVAVIALAGKDGARLINRKNSPIPHKARTHEMRMEIVNAAIDKMSMHEKKQLVKYLLDI